MVIVHQYEVELGRLKHIHLVVGFLGKLIPPDADAGLAIHVCVIKNAGKLEGRSTQHGWDLLVIVKRNAHVRECIHGQPATTSSRRASSDIVNDDYLTPVASR